MADSIPAPPPGLRAPGLRLWREVLGDFELDEHEAALLVEACRTVDTLAALDRAVRRDGVMRGGRAHPAAVEARQQRIALARLIAALRLPDGAEGDQSAGRRPQRRATRGVYGIRGAVR